MPAPSSYTLADLSLPSGLRLRGVAQGEPGGTPMLFLHGWPDSWFSYSRLLEHLPPRVRALVLDQRGFGDSDRPDSGYDIDQLADDAVAAVEMMGVERATLVGHSFGSFVARAAALRHPGRIARLVLIGTGYLAANAVTREVLASIADLQDPVTEEFARAFQASTAHLPLPPAFFDRVVQESLKLPARLWRELFRRLLQYDDTDRLAAIRVPTLLLWGDRDALFPRDDQDRLVAALPDARLIVYPDTGHCPNWERPERVAADLLGEP